MSDLEQEINRVVRGELPLEELVAGAGDVGVYPRLKNQAVRFVREIGDYRVEDLRDEGG